MNILADGRIVMPAQDTYSSSFFNFCSESDKRIEPEDWRTPANQYPDGTTELRTLGDKGRYRVYKHNQEYSFALDLIKPEKGKITLMSESQLIEADLERRKGYYATSSTKLEPQSVDAITQGRDWHEIEPDEKTGERLFMHYQSNRDKSDWSWKMAEDHIYVFHETVPMKTKAEMRVEFHKVNGAIRRFDNTQNRHIRLLSMK